SSDVCSSDLYADVPPADGPWLFYGNSGEAGWPFDRCCSVLHSPEAWLAIETGACAQSFLERDGSCVVFAGGTSQHGAAEKVDFDLPANAFYFLASCSERNAMGSAGNRV